MIQRLLASAHRVVAGRLFARRRVAVRGLSSLRIVAGSAACLAALALLDACGGGGGFTSDGSVRVVNATSDFASLDLYESSNEVVSGTANYTVSGYTDSSTGSYTFNLQSSGSSTVAATVSGAIDKRNHATVVAYTTGGALNAAFLSDEEGSPSSGSAKLRIFNTAKTEAGSVDVYLVSTECSALQSSSIAATATAVDGLQSGYTQITAGSGGTSYHLCVTATGDKSDVRLDLPTFKLTDQEIMTLILVRTSGGVLLNGLALDQQGSLVQKLNASARIRLAAGVTANGVVVATANNVSLASLSSPDVGGYALVPAGTLAMNVTVGGTAVAASGLSATAGADLTLLVAGPAGSPSVALLTDDNTPSTSTSKPVKIRLVNGFNGAGTITLSVDGTNVGSGAAFGKASATTLVAASSQTTRLKASDATTQLYLTTGNTLTSGSVYTLFLLGDLPTPTVAAPAGDTGLLRVDR